MKNCFAITARVYFKADHLQIYRQEQIHALDFCIKTDLFQQCQLKKTPNSDIVVVTVLD